MKGQLLDSGRGPAAERTAIPGAARMPEVRRTPGSRTPCILFASVQKMIQDCSGIYCPTILLTVPRRAGGEYADGFLAPVGTIPGTHTHWLALEAPVPFVVRPDGHRLHMA